MTRQQVCQTLMQYRSNLARIAHYKARIAGLQLSLQRARDRMIQDSQSLTPQLTGMPHAPGVSDKTADLAIKIADGWQTDQVKQIRQLIGKATQQMQDLQLKVDYADSWMICLTDRQQYVVRHKTIRGQYSRDVISGMRDKFGDSYSRQGIKRIQDSAITAMLQIAMD